MTYQHTTPSISNLKSKVNFFVESRMFGEAIDEILYFVDFVVRNQLSVAKVFASADLDQLCKDIADAIDKRDGFNSPINQKKEGTIILATLLSEIGGHTQIIEDIIRLNLFDNPLSILLTDAIGLVNTDEIDLMEKKFNVKIVVANGQDSAERLDWVFKFLRDQVPATLVLLNHNNDSIAISAALSRSAGKVVFIHHGDHHLALGVTCEDFIHVDPHNIGFFHCKHELGISNNFYWPLTVNNDKFSQRNPKFLVDKSLVTCSSGRAEKFDATNYLYDYFKIIANLLVVTKGHHIHIGNLTVNMEHKLQKSLSKAGIDPRRFKHIPWVPSVANALIDNNVDLYISSFPFGGGKASVEAMAAGIPLIMHQSYRSRFFSGGDLVYSGVWVWRNETELIDIVSKISLTDLKRHSLHAKAHYNKYHSDQALIDSANFLNCPKISDIPKLQEYSNNPLQIFLDENAMVADMIRQKTIDLEQEHSRREQEHSRREQEHSRREQERLSEINFLKTQCLSIKYLVSQLFNQIHKKLLNLF